MVTHAARHQTHRQPTQRATTQTPLAPLKRLTNLEELWLSCDGVTDARLVHLKGLTSLKSLHLDDTLVTDAGLIHLRGLSNLESLWLDHALVTDAGVRELQKALPKCEISNYDIVELQELPTVDR